jgi:mRNA-degrading endonuclease RelE of RelBE toxin-antitoxin system
MYRIVFTPSADEDLEWFRKTEQRNIIEATIEQLAHEPMALTKNRKPLRPNPIATWAIRIGDYRVFYDVDSAASLVTVRAVGYKDHNVLLIRGQEVSQ